MGVDTYGVSAFCAKKRKVYMERIALVSDIHSNIYALDTFMNYIDKECKVSQILNMGDFIQIGPNPTEVYALG